MINDLFLLAVGKESNFSGIAKFLNGGLSGTLWVAMSVVERTRLKVRDKACEVFVIHMATEVTIDGRSKTLPRVLYHAPELGLPLKMELGQGGPGQLAHRLAGSAARRGAAQPPRHGEHLGIFNNE